MIQIYLTSRNPVAHGITEGRGLAGAVATDLARRSPGTKAADPQDLARLDLEGDIAQGPKVVGGRRGMRGET